MINITYIYLIEGINNGSIYIGKTKNIHKRYFSHKIKYGDNISFTIIDEIYSLERKDWGPIESYWIEQFKAWGFNLLNKNKGGGGVCYHTKETLLKLKMSNVGKSKPNSGGKNKPKPNGFGKLISNVLKGRPNIKNQIPKFNLRLPVYQYDINGNLIKEHNSLSEACTYIDKPITQSGYISLACKGIKKQAFGYIWKYK